MRAVTKALDEQARSIFTELGYDVTERGSGYLAERKWRVVHVTPLERGDDLPQSGELRCFVTWAEEVTSVRRTLERTDPNYEWALISVSEEGDYEVARSPRAA